MKADFSIRRALCGMLVLGCMWMAGCGGKAEENVPGSVAVSDGTGAGGVQEGTSEDRVSVRELQSSMENIFTYDNGNAMGLQFYQGDVIQVRMVDKTLYAMKDDVLEAISDRKTDIYLDRADGSSELLAEDLPDADGMTEWYMAQDGSFYCIKPDYENNTSSIVKRDGQGAVLYEARLDMWVNDICQLAGGEVIVLLDDGGGLNSRPRLGELNQETGAVTELSQIQMDHLDQYIGAAADGLLILNQHTGIREVDVRDGSKTDIVGFADTSYRFEDVGSYGWLKDIRVSENGNVEFLWLGAKLSVRETLEWKLIDKIPVVMRGFHFNNAWIKNAVASFNKKNDTYFISLEEAGDDWDDFATRTSVQIASGGGPDLLFGEVLSDYIQGMLDKGGFENLTPYMESSGIKEEDYFPLAFSSWRRGDKIYGVNVTAGNTYCYSMDASVLGGVGVEPDIEALVEALYAYKDKAMYMRYNGAGDILNMFLEGSEDLWGMIDWEQGSCDFSGELFAKMMEVAKRYAYDENQEYPIIASSKFCSSLLHFMPPSMLEERGRVNVGVMFDDGCHSAVDPAYQILSINANSRQKQGAWEFIAYLLGEEGQRGISVDNSILVSMPVSKKIFQDMIEKDLEALKKGPVSVGSAHLIKGKYVKEMYEVTEEDVTEEWIEAFIRSVEEARPLPVRTKPVLAIICEEAEDYFNGNKSLEEVIHVIENRVRLYLGENS